MVKNIILLTLIFAMFNSGILGKGKTELELVLIDSILISESTEDSLYINQGCFYIDGDTLLYLNHTLGKLYYFNLEGDLINFVDIGNEIKDSYPNIALRINTLGLCITPDYYIITDRMGNFYYYLKNGSFS